MSGQIQSKIVTDSLVLYLDASNPNSYAYNGARVWKDLSGKGNDAYFTGETSIPIYDNDGISFNGTVQYAIVPYKDFMRIPTSTTINVWYNTSSNSGNQFMVAYDKTGWTGYILSPYSVIYSGTIGSNDFNNGLSPTPSLNNWYMMTFVVDRENNAYNLYSNGVLNNTGAISHPAISYGVNLYIGARQGPDSYFSGKISQLSYYTKTLSATEILQNYNATKSKFGL